MFVVPFHMRATFHRCTGPSGVSILALSSLKFHLPLKFQPWLWWENDHRLFFICHPDSQKKKKKISVWRLPLMENVRKGRPYAETWLCDLKLSLDLILLRCFISSVYLSKRRGKEYWFGIIGVFFWGEVRSWSPRCCDTDPDIRNLCWCRKKSIPAPPPHGATNVCNVCGLKL